MYKDFVWNGTGTLMFHIFVWKMYHNQWTIMRKMADHRKPNFFSFYHDHLRASIIKTLITLLFEVLLVLSQPKCIFSITAKVIIAEDHGKCSSKVLSSIFCVTISRAIARILWYSHKLSVNHTW